MWNNIIPQVIEMNNGNVSIAIKARDPQEQQKVQWNIQESGNFLEPSKQELQKAEEDYNDYFIQELLK
jgi:hypothetical protein